MAPLEIKNSLLRIDSVTGFPRAPFERPNETLDFFVLELPLACDVGHWCAEVAETLSIHADYLRLLHHDGAQLSLFVHYGGFRPVRFEVWFVSLLAAEHIALEFFCEGT